MNRIYLDHNATSPLRPEAQKAMQEAMQVFGNPSSLHREGRSARALVEKAREQVASLVGAKPANVVFTGSGTEANNLVLSPSFTKKAVGQAAHLVTSAGEHACVLKGHGFASDQVTTLALDRNGHIHLNELEQHLKNLSVSALVSLQLANQETGVLQPVQEAAQIAHSYQSIIHCDAVQAAGRMPFHIFDLDVDALTLSAHKLGGPKGVGALVVKDASLHVEKPLIRGGGQERGWRAGTENVIGIAGFGAACEAAGYHFAEEVTRIHTLRDTIEASIQTIAPEAVIFGKNTQRLPNTINFAIPHTTSEHLLIAFDLNGVALSSGSACSSGKVKRSHVLEAMNAPFLEGALRLSLGWSSTPDDATFFTQAFTRVVKALYRG